MLRNKVSLLGLLLTIFLGSGASAAISCEDVFSRTSAKNTSLSVRELAEVFGVPAADGAIRLSGSIAHPPHDPSTLKNDVVVKTNDIGSMKIAVQSELGMAKEITVSADQLITKTDNGFRIASATQVLNVRIDNSAEKFGSSLMLLVDITDADGASVSAYVMSSQS